jgi:hypothetical protein
MEKVLNLKYLRSWRKRYAADSFNNELLKLERKVFDFNDMVAKIELNFMMILFFSCKQYINCFIADTYFVLFYNGFLEIDFTSWFFGQADVDVDIDVQILTPNYWWWKLSILMILSNTQQHTEREHIIGKRRKPAKTVVKYVWYILVIYHLCFKL